MAITLNDIKTKADGLDLDIQVKEVDWWYGDNSSAITVVVNNGDIQDMRILYDWINNNRPIAVPEERWCEIIDNRIVQQVDYGWTPMLQT